MKITNDSTERNRSIPRILATKMILLILVCPDWFYFDGLRAVQWGGAIRFIIR